MASTRSKKRTNSPDHEVSPEPRQKRSKVQYSPDGPCSLLRSGPVTSHPLLKDVVTVRVDPLSSFELAPPSLPSSQTLGVIALLDGSTTSAIDASDPSILEIRSPTTQGHTTLGSWSQSTQPSTIQSWSQDKTVAPWTPNSPASTVAPWIRNPSSPPATTVAPSTPSPRRPPTMTGGERPPRTPPGEVGVWYEEAYASDGYDSEALLLIEGLQPSSQASRDRLAQWRRNNDQDRDVSASEQQPINTQEIFSSVAEPLDANSQSSDAPTAEPSDTISQTSDGGHAGSWSCGSTVPEPWPDEVEQLTEMYNPSHWKFPAVPMEVRHGAGCACETRCNVVTCLNARESRFCMEMNCAFGGVCGNALSERASVLLARSSRTGLRGVVATAPIPAGEVLGQYLGHLDLFGPPCKNGRVNDDNRMHLKTRSSEKRYVGVDAKERGSVLRFLNHSCEPAARFHEVQTGRVLTVVVVTVRAVEVGEQITVSYGDKLWFVCRCVADCC